jgi:hypothetical protein
MGLLQHGSSREPECPEALQISEIILLTIIQKRIIFI